QNQNDDGLMLTPILRPVNRFGESKAGEIIRNAMTPPGRFVQPSKPDRC
ncbi:MAG: hypothetical protein QG591_301, partial [Planctomycetota bacterium]|nr:hypothetical protein [Planctomycetota bacterium]